MKGMVIYMKDIKPLPFSTPEACGISSGHILRFIEKLERYRLNMHSYIILRHGKIISEGYWKPFSEDKLHRMYSISKTFTSAAIGLLCDEGKLSLTDKIVSYFPDKLPPEVHPYIADMTIRDLLIMATPYSYSTSGLQHNDWALAFFHTKPSHPAGTIFAYDTSGSYVLNVIAERITGKPFLEYMREKMLDEMGFSKDAWCVKSPEGYSWGGSGVMCTTRDLAKFAQLFLDGGRYNNRQLLSEEYVRAAVAKQIDNKTAGFDDDTCHSFGYGYQIWMTRDNSFSFLGMGDQLAVCIPEHDMVFVCTADNQGYESSRTIIYHSLWDEIINKVSANPLSENRLELELLNAKNASLEIIPLDGAKESSYTKRINGVTYILDNNPMGITKTKLIINGDRGVWEYSNAQGDKHIEFGIGKCEEGLFPHIDYFGDTIGKPAGRMYKCISSAAWVEEHKFMLRIFVTDDYFGNMTAIFSFKDNEIGVNMSKTAEWFLDEYQGFAGGHIAD